MKRTGILLWLVLLLAGCAQLEYQKEIELKPGEGGVVIRLADPSSSWPRTSVVVEREIPGREEGEAYDVGPIRGVTSTSIIFADSLPAGSYKIMHLASWDPACAYYCWTHLLKMPPRFSRFEIKAGQLTDLGTILERGELMSHEVAPDHALAIEFVQEMVPALRPLLTAPVLGWKEQSVWDGTRKLYGMSKLAGRGVAPVKSLDDVSYLSGSSTGIVFTFVPGQGRSSYDLGVNVSVDSVLPVSSDFWLAGGEFGMLMQSRDAGQSWESVRGNLPYGAVVGLDHWNGNVLATLARGNQVKIYGTRDGEKNWELLASYQRTPAVPVLLDVSGKRPQSFLLGNNLVTTLPGSRMAVLDLQVRTSEVRDLPGAVMNMSVTQEGRLRCRCLNFVASHYESNDLGKTWVDSKVQAGVAMHVLHNERGIGYMDFIPSGPKSLTHTNDGGVTWHETLSVNQGVADIFYNKDKTAAYAVSDRATRIWMSKDDGEHWQLIQAPQK